MYKQSLTILLFYGPLRKYDTYKTNFFITRQQPSVYFGSLRAAAMHYTCIVLQHPTLTHNPRCTRHTAHVINIDCNYGFWACFLDETFAVLRNVLFVKFTVH